MTALADRAPGTYGGRATAPASGQEGPDTSTYFAVGITERGPTDRAIPLRSLTQFDTWFGGEISTSALRWNLDQFWRKGGGVAYVARNIGASSAKATANLTGTGTTLVATAANDGTWGNGLEVDVVTVGSGFTVEILLDGDSVQGPYSFDTRDEVPDAFENSHYVNFTVGGGSGDPADATTALTGGANGTTSDATRLAALDLFIDDYGPGQVGVPGDTSTTAHAQVREHAAAHNRIPLTDAADAAASTTAGTAEGDWGDTGADLGAHVASIATADDGTTTPRQAAGSALLAAAIAKSDKSGKVPGTPVAALNGTFDDLKGLVREYPTEAERKLLNDAGVTVFVLDRSQGVPKVVINSDRTVSDKTDRNSIHNLSQARTLMAVEARGKFAMRPWAFTNITAKNKASIGTDLALIGEDLYAAGVIWDGKVDADGNPTGTGSYSDAFSYEVVGDTEAEAWIANLYVRPSGVADKVLVQVIRGLEA